MIAVIFEVEPAQGREQDDLAIAAEMRPPLEELDEAISVERCQSLSDPNKIPSLSYFESEDPVARWRSQTAHCGAQTQGWQGVFEDAHLRVTSVRRDNGLRDRAQPSKDSREVQFT